MERNHGAASHQSKRPCQTDGSNPAVIALHRNPRHGASRRSADFECEISASEEESEDWKTTTVQLAIPSARCPNRAVAGTPPATARLRELARFGTMRSHPFHGISETSSQSPIGLIPRRVTMLPIVDDPLRHLRSIGAGMQDTLPRQARYRRLANSRNSRNNYRIQQIHSKSARQSQIRNRIAVMPPHRLCSRQNVASKFARMFQGIPPIWHSRIVVIGMLAATAVFPRVAEHGPVIPPDSPVPKPLSLPTKNNSNPPANKVPLWHNHTHGFGRDTRAMPKLATTSAPPASGTQIRQGHD
ncbi:unnamed protein product [Tuwongella immobilis]|uniref:Uncharacterized protein n=1 Tax=Tuwongella immobilis TaxID=692036 RepID=A0A6C2YJM6_9BACT|nr:unnamed protein product [Tuwongella immobilis]VTR98379.1 unnamed protein product [Tuwongella immobilis]